MVIAIDGPAGAGKSTVSRAVARELGFTYLDTGAMYRAVGLAASESDEPAAQVAERIEIEVGDRVRIDGRDVTEAIRTPEVSEAASRVAADLGVRAALVAKQQALMAAGDWVAELACGHSQHMRHRPPWMERPWVAIEAQRAAKIGSPIDCPLCDPSGATLRAR